MPNEDYLNPPKRPTSTPHIHHVHVRVPIELWRRFRKAFPEQGDVARIVSLAMEMYLDKWEEHNCG